jgi:hypothetical protein
MYYGTALRDEYPPPPHEDHQQVNALFGIEQFLKSRFELLSLM